MSEGIQRQIDHLNRQVAQLFKEGRYEQAIDVAIHARDLAHQHLGENHPEVATTLNNLAELYREMGAYAEAEPLYRQALEIDHEALGVTHPGYATDLNNLARLHHEMGDYAKAKPLYRQALDIVRKALGENHPEVAHTLNSLAELYRETSDYSAAEPLYRRALQIDRRTLGDHHPDYATDLNNLAELHKEVGDYAKAGRLYRQVLEIMRKALGEEHPRYAVTLNNLAELYREMGDYAEAEPLYGQALKTWRKVLGENHPLVAASLNNLALLHKEIGNYAKAGRLYRQALEITRKALGENHPRYATTLNNLAELYREMGDYAQAEPLYEQALKAWRKTLGENHPKVATTLNNMAALSHEVGSYAKAELLLRQALETKRETLGEKHPDFALTLDNMAVLYKEMGEYAKAEPLYRQALEIRREALGEEHPDIAISLNNLAGLYAAIHCRDEALPLMEEAASIDDRIIGQVFSIGSEIQRMAYLGELRGNFVRFLSLILGRRSRTSTTVRTALDLLLRRKAIGAEALAAQRDAILGGRYPELAPSLQELTISRAEIAQKTLAGPGSEGLQVHRQLLEGKIDRKEQLEAGLARRIPEMNLEQHLRAADRRAVAGALPEGSVLVEFVRFEVFDFKAVPARSESQRKPARYLAFILPPEKPDEVRMIDLGEAGTIDCMIASFRASITGEAERDSNRGIEPSSVELRHVSVRSDRSALREALVVGTRHARPRSSFEEYSDNTRSLGSDLRKALFDPLIPALDGYKRLFLAPDDDLARLPFEVLPGRDGRHLIGDYQISYLGVGRDVLRFGAEFTGWPGPSLVAADPDFDLRDANGHKSSAKETPFTRLRGTRAEGERISELLGVEPLLEGRALETSVKGNRSPRILHIATHGFFLPDAPRNLNKEQPELLRTIDTSGEESLLTSRLAQAENSLLRSGLALAGANTFLEGSELPEEAEDGLLTAEDVTGMDLLATELVVLSACETGLGEVHVGEGVYGLRRAFVLAGAKTLVMSLWKVPDQQTQELMEDFYQRLLQGRPRAEALRAAQLAMKERYPNPLYWGAFICQGDPSPLTQQEP